MWSVLVGWIFIGASIAILIGAGFGVLSMSPPHHSLAQIFFSIAAIMLLGRTWWWIAFEHPPHISWLRMIVFAFCICGGISVLWYAGVRWIQELRPVTSAPPTSLPQVPFSVTRSISLGNFISIPSDPKDTFTAVRMQLLPPTEDKYPERYIINGVLLSFENGGQQTDRNVSLKVYLPGIREVVCTSDRIHVVEGSLGATSANLLVPEIGPKEKFSCRVDFTQIVNDIRTVTAWKKKYGSVTAWSQLREQFEVFIYRVSFGPEFRTPRGAAKPLARKLTIHVK